MYGENVFVQSFQQKLGVVAFLLAYGYSYPYFNRSFAVVFVPRWEDPICTAETDPFPISY